MNLNKYKAPEGKKVLLKNYSTDSTGGIKDKNKAVNQLEKNKSKMIELQDKLYAHNQHSLLIIFQAMDSAGKDSAIKHVMSGLNPQGTQVFSFKQPSKEELDHDYLWRTTKALPERGRIGIFNRSYYEEVLVVKVHDLIKYQNIPKERVKKNIWKNRYNDIRNFEEHLYQNGTTIIKFFLNLSKDEQKIRFIKRLDTPSKNWKFSAGDLEERKLWNKYQNCYQDAISETSTKNSPWYIVPADNKWFTRLVISDVIVNTLQKLKMKYPTLDAEQLSNIDKYKEELSKD